VDVSSSISLGATLEGDVVEVIGVSADLLSYETLQGSVEYLPNTSQYDGFIFPTHLYKPLLDAPLLDVIHDWIAGITGLKGDHVIPKWQRESNNPYDIADTWVSFGIMKRKADTFACEVWEDTRYILSRNESIRLLASFYGDQADQYVSIFREGMQVSQNLDFLRARNMTLSYSGDIVNVPEMIKYEWVYRQDLAFEIVRQIRYNYPILNLTSVAKGIIYDN